MGRDDDDDDDVVVVFKDILTSGQIRLSSPLKEEISNGEYPGLPRLVMNFNLRDYGRLCEMIHVINQDK